MRASYKKHILTFKQPSGTSRGVLNEKETWYIKIEHEGRIGIGECGVLRSLSYDDRENYEEMLHWVVQNITLGKEVLWEELRAWPSIQFGVEQAFISLHSQDPFILFPSLFTSGDDSIAINGLVWMGEEVFMKEQLDEKIAAGFTCVKLKIGAIDFDKEIGLLNYVRESFPAKQLELRVDANGAFSTLEVEEKLEKLKGFGLHSIEQPIRQGQVEEMRILCDKSIIPIALDEELIGIVNLKEKRALLERIKPQYIILKPSLVGGFKGSLEWIELANELSIGWWITSALESNVGLNAIAQWTFLLHNSLPQGLGTGGLYLNNIKSPLYVNKGRLWYNSSEDWDVDMLI